MSAKYVNAAFFLAPQLALLSQTQMPELFPVGQAPFLLRRRDMPAWRQALP
jgi:hypothetical protein